MEPASWTRQDDRGVTLLTLRRPPINALDHRALEELDRFVGDLEAARVTRAVVIASGLDGVFCSGGDLKHWRQITDGKEVSRAGRSTFHRLESLPMPVIGAISGDVIGDGMALALACDIRIASDRATFRLPEIAYGFIPGWGPIRPLVELVGRANAADLLFTGRSISADRAREMGLVSEVIPPERVLELALERGHALAMASDNTLRAAKCVLRGADETACFERVWGSAAWQEGIDALLSKRPPDFTRQEEGGGDHDLPGGVQEHRASNRGSHCC